MAKITYEDKQNLTTDPELLRINKVIDDDMNEIKQVVNENDDSLNSIIPDIITSANSGNAKIGKLGVEWGTVSLSASNGYVSEQITLQNVYTNPPGALAVAGVGTSSITNVGVFGVTNNSISVFMVATNDASRTCRYLVIGELANEVQ